MQTYTSHRHDTDGIILVTDRGINVFIPNEQIPGVIAALQRQRSEDPGQLNDDRRQHWPTGQDMKLGNIE